MNRKNGNITKERKELIQKAEAYFDEFEDARVDLEESSKKFGRNLLIVASIGLGLAITYKLISGDDDENHKSEAKEAEYKSYKKPSRFGSALKALAVPFLVGIAKNIVLPDLKSSKNQSDGGNP